MMVYRQSCQDEAVVGILPLKIRHTTKQNVATADVSLVAFPRHDVIVVCEITKPILPRQTTSLFVWSKLLQGKGVKGIW
jgi:hypothetical protein